MEIIQFILNTLCGKQTGSDTPGGYGTKLEESMPMFFIGILVGVFISFVVYILVSTYKKNRSKDEKK